MRDDHENDWPADASFDYRPQWSDVDDDGVIRLRVSVWTADDHSACIVPVSPDNEDYFFWAWLIGDPAHGRTTKSAAEIAELKQAFEKGLRQ